MESKDGLRGGERIQADGRAAPASDASIGDLFKRVTTDSSHLIRQEIALAKAELREGVSTAIGAGTKIGIAAAIALPGVMAVTAALVIGLGILIHSYWGSALIVGVIMLAVAGVLVKKAAAGLKAGIVPTKTAQSIHDDAEWAKSELPRVKLLMTTKRARSADGTIAE
jgi:uncharacterized membrane protein YqjE